MIVERTNILSKLVMKKNEPEPYGISAYEKITNNLGLDIGIEQTDTWDSTSTVNQQNMKALRTMLDPSIYQFACLTKNTPKTFDIHHS